MTLTRRDFLDFLKATCAVAALPNALIRSAGAQHLSAVVMTPTTGSEPVVNDIHSQLNATRVNRIIKPLTENNLYRFDTVARCHDNNST
jgi:hypothetical protein